jgi:prepilin-type processing-associated H-X9-DG protein
LLVCPDDPGATPAPGDSGLDTAESLHTGGRHVSYTYTGAGLTNAARPEMVLLYEPLAHHRTGMHVLFADGRVNFIGEVEATKATARLQSGLNPPWTATDGQ